MGKRILKCLNCGKEYKAFRLSCDNGCNSLLRAYYEKKEFKPTREKNIFKFLDWLPCENKVATSIGPIVYKSEKLGQTIGLKNLYCAFNGYWPERGAGNMTGTFKDYEALPTILYSKENGVKKIVLSSAGNTARAFAYAAAILDFDTYIVVPEKMLYRLWLPIGNSAGRVHVIAIKDSRDYYRAIKLANILANRCGIAQEGGAKNIARRDGMGTVMLEAVRTIGNLPDHYFQAVGSGTGGIAAYEASLRLKENETFKQDKIPRLHLAQNAPFAPIYKCWHENVHIEPEENIENQLEKINCMYADVLANRNPPYHVKGGIHNVLEDTNGIVYKVSNQKAMESSQLFEEQEGVDLTPAASVCVAALIMAIKKGLVKKEDTILMNITGGGIKKLKKDYHCCEIEPEIVVEDEYRFNWEQILNS